MDKPSVLFAILFAAIVLRETLTWHHWLGGGLVLTGTVILAFKLRQLRIYLERGEASHLACGTEESFA
jgi:hypothetical protein